MQEYRKEEQFCDAIEQILRQAGLSFSRNHQVSSGRIEVDDATFMYDRTGNLYADFFIQGTEKAIIECKLKPSPLSFYSGIGQCLVYKHNTNAKHLILCMPRCNETILYYRYRPICYENNIWFSTEVDLIRKLEQMAGSLDVFRRKTHPVS